MPSLAEIGYRLAKPALYRIGDGDAESAHHWTLRRLELLDRNPRLRRLTERLLGSTADPVTVFGVRFPSRVGLAAGMAKNAEALRAWRALGFGHVEVGTVTWHPQPGNDRPRLFRLAASEALINRMGFNNGGAEAMARRLAGYGADATGVRNSAGLPVGISLGKSKVTPVDEAVEDYLRSLRALRGYASYLAVNVSSPNTPGLRSLQDKGFLTELVAALTVEADGVPLLVKIAPDLSTEAIDDVLGVCRDHAVAGIIATNTTIERDGLAAADQPLAAETGGLSGRPLTVRSREIVRHIHRATSGELPIIGVGGISGPDDAEAMLDSGASLVQVYSALIYQGPALIAAINQRLAARR